MKKVCSKFNSGVSGFSRFILRGNKFDLKSQSLG